MRAMMSGAPAIVLGYHRVADTDRDPHDITVTPSHFADHLDVLAERTRVVPLDQLGRGGRGGRGETRPEVAITFDDGYADNAELAVPMLRERSLCGTVFVTSGVVDDPGEFWWDRLDHLLLDDQHDRPPFLSLTVGARPLYVDIRGAEGRLRAVRALNLRLTGLPRADIEAALARVQEALGAEFDPATCGRHRRLSARALRAMADSGHIDIGGHTRTHTALSALSEREQLDEIAGCRDDLASLTGHRITSFAYPFGVPRAFTAATPRIVRDAGFARAYTTMRGRTSRFGDRFRIPRFVVSDCDRSAFEQSLSSWLAA